MIKFIHTGDIHLGLQFRDDSFPTDIASNRRVELWNTFERIVDKAIDDKVDFLFITGDLYEEKYFTLGDIKRVRDILSQAKDINIMIIAGNHDPINSISLYKKIEWSENVNIFNTTGIEKIEFPEKNTCIYGYSWDKTECKENILDSFEGVEEGNINILLLHGDIFDSESVYLPLDKNYLNNLGFDYIGLGHIHKPNIISSKMAYCGSPEPLHFGEQGEHGIIQGQIDGQGTNIEFIPFSNRVFLEKTLKIDPNYGYVDIINEIKNCDDEARLNKNLYRIKLEGILNSELEIDIKDMVSSLEEYFYYIEIIDNTVMDYDLDSLEKENEDNIIGYFIKAMKNKDLENKVVREALYIGLEALMKGKVG
ncbi:DNA repair exonuclease SbcCD nuclease subunit [Keratinibaculum paraultunense]|uniref:DNA repair exonuclease SbcCD nuclease subunit n=1 Tax=Keratinibaculum paraultunense TaxID=1278232 RepID=A0A4R3KXD1_9FIRM|nr:DNA repair exonuclease [Keratinibaculum paraultunense]QQY78885.1 DNA repair exonuclease [Keratinibaculum paraultunense]TCS90497.1 DNA repair exonuclease SbcCD nuclease subunit [Keratinibaculum paraultunense]